jgi:hypothetical protein
MLFRTTEFVFINESDIDMIGMLARLCSIGRWARFHFSSGCRLDKDGHGIVGKDVCQKQEVLVLPARQSKCE